MFAPLADVVLILGGIQQLVTFALSLQMINQISLSLSNKGPACYFEQTLASPSHSLSPLS